MHDRDIKENIRTNKTRHKNKRLDPSFLGSCPSKFMRTAKGILMDFGQNYHYEMTWLLAQYRVFLQHLSTIFSCQLFGCTIEETIIPWTNFVHLIGFPCGQGTCTYNHLLLPMGNPKNHCVVVKL